MLAPFRQISLGRGALFSAFLAQIKVMVGGTHFTACNAVMAAAEAYLIMQDKAVFQAGITAQQ